VSAVSTAPSWAVNGGSTYVFVGSAATAGQAYAYRINMTSNTISGSFSGITSNVNDGLTLVNGRAYAVTNGGALHVLDAFNFNTGGFKNLAGFPYQSASAKPIKMVPWIDSLTNTAYFGDDGGNLYVVTGTGALLAGYPFAISSAIQVSSSPLYLEGSGVIAVGANDGYLYFIDRHDTSNAPNIFKRFFVTAAGAVSTVAYDNGIGAYLVSSSDGRLVYINASDVADPTMAME
jgi:hypothetical protein